jgi:hypothetical protein
MSAIAVCADVPQVADGTAFTGCTLVEWVDASELPTNLFSGVTVEQMAPIYGAILLSWAAAWGIRRAIDVLAV